MKKFSLLAFLLLITACASNDKAEAYTAEGYAKFIRQVKLEARDKGISYDTLDKAFANPKFNFAVVQLDRKQPERSNKPGWQNYKKRVINETRINKAKKLLAENYQTLSEVERTFGVEKEFIVALWSVESNFGQVQGGFNVINALASLAYEGRRNAFFREELMHALAILDERHVDVEHFKGSWAGAFGQCQFMPSTFNKYAYDFSGDGKKDIWNNRADVFASASNYLHNIGWQHQQGWGRQALLPSNFNTRYIDTNIAKPLYEWKKMGVTYADGTPLPDSDINASIVVPDFNTTGQIGEVYIVYDNFKRIMHWNKSTYFATSIGLIADRIRQ